MVKEGHIVGNHSMNHPDMSAISDEAAFEKELAQVEAAYKAAVEEGGSGGTYGDAGNAAGSKVDGRTGDSPAGQTTGTSREKTVQMPKYYRPPQGKFSPANLKMAKKLGYKTVFWSLAYVDWNVDRQPTREEALQTLLPRTHKGAVILLHSTSKTNAKVLGELIERWKAKGYRFGTLDELTAG